MLDATVDDRSCLALDTQTLRIIMVLYVHDAGPIYHQQYDFELSVYTRGPDSLEVLLWPWMLRFGAELPGFGTNLELKNLGSYGPYWSQGGEACCMAVLPRFPRSSRSIFTSKCGTHLGAPQACRLRGTNRPFRW